MKVLLTGANGQVGRALAETIAAREPGWELAALTRQDLNLAEPGDIARMVAAHAPNVILNTAAYTAVDQAEKEPDLAMAINGEAPGVLARAAISCGAFLVHYSTDYVFSGEQEEPYREDDPTGPLSVYGQSKLMGEQAIRATGAPHWILRTCWVYDHAAKNFLTTLFRLASERDHLRVVDDQIGAPTSSQAIAAATIQGLRNLGGAGLNPSSGTYHLACDGETSWHGFAVALLDKLLTQEARAAVRIEPIPSAAYPTLAQRPRNSRLSTQKIKAAFGITLPDWPSALAEVCARRQLLT